METKKVIAQLEALIIHDGKMYQAYTEALLTVDVPEVRNRLMSFKADHEKHASEFISAVRKLGGKPVSQLKTASSNGIGTERMLKALRAHELLALKKYDAALTLNLPVELKELLLRHRDDERRHLQYLERCIEQCVWQPTEMKTA